MKNNQLVFRILVMVSVAVFFVAVGGCDLLGSDTDGGGGGGGGGSASKNLRELPEIEAQLPASLASGGSTGSGSVVAAEVGDVTNVSTSSLPDVKAQGWYDMKDAAGLDETTEAFLDELREIATEQELEFGVVYDVGERLFLEETYDLGQMKLTGSENDLTVYWYAEPYDPVSDFSFTFWGRIHVVRNGDDWSVTANFQTGGFEDMKIYADFSTATGESLFLSRSSGTGFDGSAYTYNDITQSVPNSDGSLTILSGYSDGSGGWAETRIGWGDDTMGGVIGVGSWGDESYASQEFYNGDGSLLQQSWGTGTIRDYGISWVENGGWGFNLNDYGFVSASSEVYLFDVWEGASRTQYVSIDNALDTASDAALSSDAYTPYFKASSAWIEGDAVYNWVAGGSYDDGNPATSVRRTTYEIGYQIPAATTIFGGSYYFEDRYPLKHLLPLTGAYLGKTIIREEGSTFTDTWTDGDGNDQSWSWTNYTYYVDVDGDAAVGIDDIFMDGVWLSENWVWDSANQRELVVKAPFLTTTGGKFPGYLSFSTQSQSLVDSIETKINDIYNNDLSSLSVDAHAGKLEDLSGLPEFDDIEF